MCSLLTGWLFILTPNLPNVWDIANQSPYMANSKVLKIFLDIFQNWADLCPLEASLSEMWWLQDT